MSRSIQERCYINVLQSGTVPICASSYKTKNLRRDPRIWLCVFPRNWFGDWVQVECRAEIISGRAALEPLVDYYRTLRGEHPDWDEYRQAMVTDQRCLVRFHILRAGPDRSG